MRPTLMLCFFLFPLFAFNPAIGAESTGTPIATIDITMKKTFGDLKGDVFFVNKINGKQVGLYRDRRVNARTESSGRGETREVAAGKVQIELIAAVSFDMSVAYVFNAGNNYRVGGIVELELLPGRHYVVNGLLTETVRAVWLEDSNGVVVSDVIESLGQSTQENREGTLLPMQEALKRYGAMPPLPSHHPLNRVQKLLSIRLGATFTHVVSKLGRPDRDEREESIPLFRRGLITVYYEGLGTLYLVGDKEMFSYVTKIHLETERLYQAHGEAFIELVLESKVPETISAVLARYKERNDFTPAVLDRLARYVEDGYLTEDRSLADGMSYACYILAQENTGKFRTLLARVADGAGSSKLLRHSKKALKRMPEPS